MKPGASDPKSSAFERLRLYLQERASLTTEEIAFLRELFIARRLRKREFLQRTSEPARYAVFVARGCLRSYVIDEQGKEHIIQFAPEDWWLSDADSLASGAPATFFIDALEDSDVLLIRFRRRTSGFSSEFPAMQRRFELACSAMRRQRIGES